MSPELESGPQVGLVVVTHGGSGGCLLSAAAGLVGPLPASTSVAVELSDRFEDIVRHTIEDRPYTAVAIALALGWLFGRTHRPL